MKILWQLNFTVCIIYMTEKELSDLNFMESRQLVSL